MLVVDEDGDLAAPRGIFDGVLDEVAERLGEQLPVAEDRDDDGRAVEAHGRARFLGDRLVHFDQLTGELRGIEPAELVPAGEGFRAGDLQRRRQDPHQRVRLADDRAEHLVALLAASPR